MLYYRFFLSTLLLVLLSCSSTESKRKKVCLESIISESFCLSELEQHNASVLIFVSPECPVCQNMTYELNRLRTKFSHENIRWIAVVPGNNFTTDDILSFSNEYKLNIPILLDKDLTLTKNLNATVTPEVFLLNNDLNVMYRGAINNSFEDVGKKRQVITDNYLEDALNSLFQNKKIQIPKTKPVGCFIE